MSVEEESAKPDCHGDQSPKQDDHQTGCGALPRSGEGRSGEPGCGADDEPAPRENWDKRVAIFSLVFDGIVALTAIAGGIVIYQQLALTREQLDMTREQFHVDKRPWVVQAQVPITGLRGEDTIVFASGVNRAKVWLMNTGDSPALNVHARACLVPGYAMPTTECASPSLPGESVLGPDRSIFIGVARELTEPEMLEIAAGKLSLWILAAVDYRDHFAPEAHRHRSRFCWQYSIGDQGWIACDGRNSAD